MTNGKSTGSNNWSAWSQHVLLELERLATLENKQDEDIQELRNRTTRLEERLRFQAKTLLFVVSTAVTTFVGIVVLFVEYFWLQ